MGHKNQRPMQRGPDLNDPFDPTNATKNYKKREEQEEEEAKAALTQNETI